MMFRSMEQARPARARGELLRRTVGLLRPYRWSLLGLLVLLAITVSMDLASVRLLGVMVDRMAPGGSRSALDRLIFVYVAIVLGSATLGVLESYVNQVMGQGLMHRLRADLHSHLQRLSVRFYTSTRTGEILSRISTDVNAVQQAVTGTFTDFLSNVLTLTIAFALMFTLDWRLALATVLVLPLWVYPTIRVGQHMRTMLREWHEESARMAAHLEETLSVSGSMLVKTFGRQEHEAAPSPGSRASTPPCSPRSRSSSASSSTWICRWRWRSGRGRCAWCTRAASWSSTMCASPTRVAARPPSTASRSR